MPDSPAEFSPFPGYEDIPKADRSEADRQKLADEAKRLNVAQKADELRTGASGFALPVVNETVSKVSPEDLRSGHLDLSAEEKQRLDTLRARLKQD